jgi:hypothetical protein
MKKRLKIYRGVGYQGGFSQKVTNLLPITSATGMTNNSATTLNLMTFSIMTFSIKTLSIKGLYVTLSNGATKHKQNSA